MQYTYTVANSHSKSCEQYVYSRGEWVCSYFTHWMLEHLLSLSCVPCPSCSRMEETTPPERASSALVVGFSLVALMRVWIASTALTTHYEAIADI